jgi:capsid protein
MGLMPIEGIQIMTPAALRKDPQVVNGIRVGASGAEANLITHFYVCNRGPHGGLDMNNFTRVRHSNAFFSHNDWRPAQVRGVPKLHGVVDLLLDHDATHTNVVNNIKFASSIFTLEREGARKRIQPRIVTDTEGAKTTYEQTPIGISIKTTGEPNKDFILPEIKNPNPQFVPTMEYEAGLVSAGTGYPYSMLMNKFSQASYMPHRAERVALEILLYREWMDRIRGLCQPAWNYAIAKAMKNGEIRPAPLKKLRNGMQISQWFRVEWSLPYVPEIDQGREEEARAKAWANCNATLSDWARARKTTLKAVLDERDIELKEIQRRATALGISMTMYAPGLFESESKPAADPAKPQPAAAPDKENGDDPAKENGDSPTEETENA